MIYIHMEEPFTRPERTLCGRLLHGLYTVAFSLRAIDAEVETSENQELCPVCAGRVE